MVRRARPYQAAAVGSVYEAFPTRRAVLVVMATGMGKTFVFTDVAAKWLARGSQYRVLVVVHRDELAEQAAISLSKGVDADVGVDMGRFHDRRRRVVVSSVQSLSRGRIKGYDPSQHWLVIFDEAHHAIARTWRLVAAWFGLYGPTLPDRSIESRLLGVTATPGRGDKEAMGQLFNHVAANHPIRWGVEEGWLVRVDTRTVLIKGLDFSRVKKDRKGDLSEAALAKILTEEGPLHGIAKKTIEHAEGERPTLLFCAGVEHAKLLAQVLNRYQSDSAAFASGDTDMDLRRRIIADYKRGRIQYLCNCGLFLEGFDAPATSVVGMARPTKSLPLYTQVLGRGTRPLEGVVDDPLLLTAADRIAAIRGSAKPSMTMLDFVGQAADHRLVSAVDVLGGEYTIDEEIDIAALLTKVRAEQTTDTIAALQAAKAIREFDLVVREIEEDDRRRAAEDRKAWLVADRVDAVERYVDAFAEGEPRGGSRDEYIPVMRDPLTENQLHALIGLGVDADTAMAFSRKQAGAVIGRMRKRQEEEWN